MLRVNTLFKQSSSIKIDRIETSASPVVRVIGWYNSPRDPAIQLLEKNNQALHPNCIYRTLREDVYAVGEASIKFSGFTCEFYSTAPAFILVEGKKHEIPGAATVGSVVPHYAHLLTTDQYLTRDQIYGYGPPVDVNEEVVEFCRHVQGKVLDFGCGNGDLVGKLRKEGMEIFGIELDSERVRGKIKPGSLDYVTLYNGRFPMPFDDASFDYIVASEVVEHIPNVEDLPKEFARLAKKGILISVPDMTSIPTGFLSGVVPWHLLESTHVNFFNHKSISNLFREYFTPEKFFRLGTGMVNNMIMPGSLGVLMRKKE